MPLALGVAARIQERAPEDVVHDPTHLANALRDLVDACEPDGVPVATPATLTAHGQASVTAVATDTAVEATRRLRASMGDRLVLVACLPGAAATEGGCTGLLDLGKAFLAAGADVIVVLDDAGAAGAPLDTLGNIARFHQALALGTMEEYGLPLVRRQPLTAPVAGAGVVLTDVDLPRDTDVTAVTDWVHAVRGTS
ncbi:hypothetical protein [Euzebya sp.]|uniref:hypothetical protein n=1 Tax=Euzebya sp. TaxID=1971409 RepID=UPI003518037C